MDILILQPHADDAVWSMAEHMLTWQEDGHYLAVATVFGAAVRHTDPAREEKHRVLDAEHGAVLRAMGITMVSNGPFSDDGWGLPRPLDLDLRTYVGSLLSHPFDVIVAPTGIWHPDHVQLGLNMQNYTWQSPRRQTWIYDELPYYVQHPELATMCLPAVGHREHLARKKELCRMYASQLNPPDTVERCIYAPERVWKYA